MNEFEGIGMERISSEFFMQPGLFRLCAPYEVAVILREELEAMWDGYNFEFGKDRTDYPALTQLLNALNTYVEEHSN